MALCCLLNTAWDLLHAALQLLHVALPLLLCLCVLLVTRAMYVFIEIYNGRKSGPKERKPSKKTVKTMIVAGSGGHTGEILRVVDALKPSYTPRVYLVAETDQMSKHKIEATEEKKENSYTQYKVHHIPRSRDVGQSYITSILTTLKSFCYTFPLVWREMPDLLLVNGPGTCIPACIAAFILRFIGLHKVIIIYVESFCRVKTLSLSGKILYYIADQFIVQWPDLKEKKTYVKCMGRVV